MEIPTSLKFREYSGPAIIIGSGGGSKVILLTQKSMNRQVAVKILRFKGEAAAAIEKKSREVSLLKNLHESYFPQVYEFFVANEAVVIPAYTDAAYSAAENIMIEPGQAVMVMEYVRGYSLSQYLSGHNSFTPEQVIKYGYQICDAVSILHSQQPAIIHGDIKPANIIIREGEDKICLLDFNISGESDQYGRAYTFGASGGYAPPEQYQAFRAIGTGTVGQYLQNNPYLDDYSRCLIAAGKVPVNKQCDVYSLGATLYHMISGQKFDPAVQITVGQDFSEGLKYIVERALSRDPEDRFEDAVEMRRTFRNLHLKDNRYKSLCRIYNALRIIIALTAVVGIGLIVYGYRSIDVEKQELYDEYVEMIIEARQDEDPLAAQTGYNNARSLYPNRSEAYYQMLAYLYDEGQYAEIVNFWEDEMPGAGRLTPADYAAEIYNIYANSLFELEMYDAAAQAWEDAVDYDSENSEYYVNLAVAYVNANDIAAAQDILDRASEFDIESDGITYITGQLQYRQGDYAAAEESFRYYISQTADSRMLCNAYRQCNRVLSARLESATSNPEERNLLYEERIILLNSALAAVEEGDRPVILQELAQAAMDGYREFDSELYYNSAIDALNRIIDTGWGTEQTYANVVNTHIHAGNYEQALASLAQMEEQIADSFEAAKLGARIELNYRINGVSQPDASGFVEYYRRAVDLGAQYGRSSDTELQALTEAYNDLVRRGVI